jgi:hypothetical protein
MNTDNERSERRRLAIDRIRAANFGVMSVAEYVGSDPSLVRRWFTGVQKRGPSITTVLLLEEVASDVERLRAFEGAFGPTTRTVWSSLDLADLTLKLCSRSWRSVKNKRSYEVRDIISQQGPKSWANGDNVLAVLYAPSTIVHRPYSRVLWHFAMRMEPWVSPDAVLSAPKAAMCKCGHPITEHTDRYEFKHVGMCRTPGCRCTSLERA